MSSKTTLRLSYSEALPNKTPAYFPWTESSNEGGLFPGTLLIMGSAVENYLKRGLNNLADLKIYLEIILSFLLCNFSFFFLN
jgi:hypothetical protein